MGATTSPSTTKKNPARNPKRNMIRFQSVALFAFESAPELCFSLGWPGDSKMQIRDDLGTNVYYCQSKWRPLQQAAK